MSDDGVWRILFQCIVLREKLSFANCSTKFALDPSIVINRDYDGCKNDNFLLIDKLCGYRLPFPRSK